MKRAVIGAAAGCVLAVGASSLAFAQASTLTANPDAATTAPGAPVTIAVLANDVDTDAVILPGSLTIASPATSGQAVADPTTGTVIYVPAAGFAGTDAFSYEVCDALGTCAVGTVTVTVGTPVPVEATPPAAGWPSANNDTMVANQDQPATFNVLANDGDVAGTIVPSTLSIVTKPQHGTATANTDGTITYTPNPGYYGSDGLVYQICDNQVVSMCSNANVTIGVNSTPATSTPPPPPTTTPSPTTQPPAPTVVATQPAPAPSATVSAVAPLPPNTGSGVAPGASGIGRVAEIGVALLAMLGLAMATRGTRRR